MGLLPESYAAGASGHLAHSAQIAKKLNGFVDPVADFGVVVGEANSTTRMQDAIDAAVADASALLIPYTGGSFINCDNLTVDGTLKILNHGGRLQKRDHGPLFSVTNGQYVEFHGVQILANAPTFTGGAVVVSGGAGVTDHFKWFGGFIFNPETYAIEFSGANSGKEATVALATLQTYKVTLTDASITASDSTLTSPSAAWTDDDVGKQIFVQGAGEAGGNYLATTIASRNSATSVELADPAITTVSGVSADYHWPCIMLPDDGLANADRMIAYNFAEGCCLVDLNASQNTEVEGNNTRQIASSGLARKPNITGNRIAPSGGYTTINSIDGNISGNEHSGGFRHGPDAERQNCGPNKQVHANIDLNPGNGNVSLWSALVDYTNQHHDGVNDIFEMDVTVNGNLFATGGAVNLTGGTSLRQDNNTPIYLRDSGGSTVGVLLMTTGNNLQVLSRSGGGNIQEQVLNAANFWQAYVNSVESAKIGAISTNDDTALWLARQQGGTVTLQRVTQGSADSGGTGFKLLRVPN